MSDGVVKLRLPRDVVKKLLASREVSVSRGISQVLDKYSERVDSDVLEELLKERR